jgi:MFS transporter, DHA3 family, macrolide efflux protein
MAFRAAFLSSAFGYEFLFFIMTLRVYAITGRAVSVGFFTALTFIPKMLSPFYGGLVDVMGARKVLVYAAWAAAALTLCLGLSDGIGSLYGVWFFLSALFMLIGNARTVVMTETAQALGAVRNNSLVLAFLTTARLLAPLSAGFLSRAVGFEALIFISAGIYALCAASAAFIARPALGGGNAVRADRTFSAFLEGFALVRATKGLKTMASIGVLWRLFLGMQASLLVVYVTDFLGRSVSDYALAMAIIAAGGLVGSLSGPLMLKVLRPRHLAGAGVCLHFLCFAALGLITEYPFALVALGFGHFALYAAVVALHSKRDASTRQPQRGRVYGAVTAMLTPPAVISMVVGGAFADRYGVALVMATSGIAAVAAFCLVCAPWVKTKGPAASVRPEIPTD